MSTGLGIKQFIEKVREGDIDAIRSNLATHGLPRNSRAYTDYTALRTALTYDSYCHIEIAKLLISQGCRINPESEHPIDPTPLHLAVARQDVEIATMLLERNGKPYIKTVFDGSIMTVLHVAVWLKLPNMLEIILTYDVNVNEPDDSGQTALQLLTNQLMNESPLDTYVVFEAMIRLLLSKGATLDLNKLDSRGNTVLHVMLQKNYILADDEDLSAVIRSITSLNSVLDRQNFVGKTPLHLAAENRQKRVLEILLPLTTNIDIKDAEGNTPLNCYLQSCCRRTASLATIEILLKKGASVEAKNTQGIAPVHVALGLQSKDIAMKLLERIDNADLCDNFGNSLLHFLAGITYIAKFGDFCQTGDTCYPANFAESPEIARMILAKNATIDLCGWGRYTPLHISLMCRQSHLVRFLLEQEANANAISESGDTPLHLLKDTITDEPKNVDTTITDMLIARGANLEIVNNSNMSALHMLANKKQLRMMLGVLRHCCKKIVMLKDEDDNTALHVILASFSCNAVKTELYVEITNQFLLKAGDCLANIPNKSGETLLHLAAKYKHFEVMQLLLLNGADPMLCDRRGNTLLHIVLQCTNNYCRNVRDMNLQSKLEEMIKEMLAKRCSLVNARNHEGDTPLHVAFLYVSRKVFLSCGMLHLIRILLEHGADPNTQTSSGYTALFLASMDNMTEAAKELLKYGADINDFEGLLSPYELHATLTYEYMLHHALKIREAGLPLVEANSVFIQKRGSFGPYAEEVLEMKRYQLSERITVADVLRIPASRLVVYASNLELRQLIFESKEFALKFPNYLDLIRANFRKAVIRSDFMGSAKLALDRLCRFSWPYICSEKIFENLTTENLLNLIDANPLNINYKTIFKDLDEDNVREVKRLKSDNV